MVDRIPRSQHAAAGLLSLLRLQSCTSARTAPVASTSYHTLSSDTHASQTIHRHRQDVSRAFSTSSSTQVSAHRKQAGREKARLRSTRMEEKVLRRREKDSPYSASHPKPSSSRRPRDPIEEDVESNIRAYMARTGPKGERLTRSQQERLLKQELRGLGEQLEKLEKKAKADKATEGLPELDDQLLDELYQALMLPLPPSAEEVRLARLEGGRREKSLLGSDGRGRRGMERIGGVVRELPMSAAAERKLRTSRDLKQRLLDARERAMILLPPSSSMGLSERDRLREAKELQREEEVMEQEDGLDMAALPYAERQEIRLQQLFARLALVHSTPDPREGETGPDSLQEIKSNLASRIAKILQQHEYQLNPSLSNEQQQEAEITEPEEGQQPDSKIPPFESIRLDNKASLSSTDVSPTPQDQTDLVARAETMINDLSSPESRSFMLDGIERLVHSAVAPTSGPSAGTTSIPLGVATIDEWTALAVSSTRADDSATLSRTLSLMDSAGYRPAPLSLYNDVLDVFASRGQVAQCQEWMGKLSEAGLTPDDHTYHSLTKAYINSAQFLPAIELLNSLEVSGRPASMATYNMVIDRLLEPVPVPEGGKQERPELQALAWNVFYHMRLQAHPVPDAPLYALMIRACARGIPQPTDIDDPTQPCSSLSSPAPTVGGAARISDAERALDLFREMTTRYNVRPNAEVYNSLILACARRKDFYLEAFRLLREMVELETERAGIPEEGAEGVMRFAPDRYTFNALLQGCARNRDLARARWVLAEMIRTTLPLFDEETRGRLSREQVVEVLAKRPNEETMCHIFHTYASYVPPIRREQLQRVQGDAGGPSAHKPTKNVDDSIGATTDVDAGKTDLQSTNTTEVQKAEGQEEDETTAEEAAQVFSALVPQTSSDLVSESRSLFARILADQPSATLEGPLGGVSPGVRLVNAYLTVLAAHLPPQQRAHVLQSVLADQPQEGATLEHALFERLGLRPNEHSYRIILEALSDASSPEAQKVVQEVWGRFERFLGSGGGAGGRELVKASEKGSEVVDAEQVKKCWSAYIHFWAKNVTTSTEAEAKDGLDRAMDLLRRFVSLYPPQVQPKKSRQAKKRAAAPPKLTMSSDALTELKLDLSPLPVPVKSLQSLHALSSSLPPPAGEEAEDIREGEAKESFKFMSASPRLSFLDVQLLHHRLVRYGRIKDLAYLSWVLHRYRAASR